MMRKYAYKGRSVTIGPMMFEFMPEKHARIHAAQFLREWKESVNLEIDRLKDTQNEGKK